MTRRASRLMVHAGRLRGAVRPLGGTLLLAACVGMGWSLAGLGEERPNWRETDGAAWDPAPAGKVGAGEPTAPAVRARRDVSRGAPPSPSSGARRADPLHDLDVEPHPLTAERAAAARQHALFSAVEDAIAERAYERARSLLAEHQRQFAEGDAWQSQRLGYERALDCLETPGEEARARGAEYVASERLSPLRRHVRRTCLQGRPFSRRGAEG